MLDDLRTGATRSAAIEDASPGQIANVILVADPPLWAFAARLVELEHAVRLRPAEVERDPPPRDDRPRAVVQLQPSLVLVETKVQEGAGKVARLRYATDDTPLDLARERVGSSKTVFRLVLEEAGHVAERGKADPEDVRVVCGEHHLVEQVGIKSIAQTDLRWVRRAGEGMVRIALAPGPVAARDS